MQLYLIEILLGLNLLCVIYLVVRVSFGQKFNSELELDQKQYENQKQISREIYELKMSLNQFHQSFLHEFEQWRIEKQAFTATIDANTKPNKEQNLFLNDRFKEIFELHNQGLSVDQIAKKLDKGSGEVAFILQLADQTRR